ncbi:hypothetical protein L3Y34_010573 [Caenorhabditis briggsae]|uniref:Uncharacterized protein n=1 Tax=Caenorhabditis briggsae TaxID=6238 RepID=A0AAE8ZNW4_CAEBR|nr:hypothetical protein L3Y34_010573 [Caenorhabditis briggsae]
MLKAFVWIMTSRGSNVDALAHFNMNYFTTRRLHWMVRMRSDLQLNDVGPRRERKVCFLCFYSAENSSRRSSAPQQPKEGWREACRLSCSPKKLTPATWNSNYCFVYSERLFATDDFAAEKRSGTAQKLYLVRDAGFDVPLKSSRDCAQGSSEANDRSDVHCEQEEDILFSSKNVQQQIKEKHNQVDMITRMKNHIIEVMKIVPNGSLTCQWNHSEHWKPNDGLHMLDAGGEGQFPANFKFHLRAILAVGDEMIVSMRTAVPEPKPRYFK